MTVNRAPALCVALALVAAGAANPHPAPAQSPAPSLSPLELSPAAAADFAALALACIDRPFPCKSDRVLEDARSVRTPQSDNPAFFGCFDWHSAVHGHWMLVRLARLFPGMESTPRIRAALGEHFSKQALLAEAGFVNQDAQRLFERPYGWAWVFRLAADLRAWDDEQARLWARNLGPLETALAQLFREYLAKLAHPVRTGVHANTAFAMAQALDYARATGAATLAEAIEQRSRAYFAEDRNCPVAYEPSGEDFFSPCLMEADLMRRVLPEADFRSWLGRFFPGAARGDLGPLSKPAVVTDPSDGRIVHLDGLNLTRAWTMRGIASALPATDPRRRVFVGLAAAHAEAGLARVASGHYEGEHWLASFAVYLLTDTSLVHN